MRRRSYWLTAALLCAGLVLGGCGGKKSAEKSASAEKSTQAVSAVTVAAEQAQTADTATQTAASTATLAVTAETAETARAQEKNEPAGTAESADAQPKAQTPAPAQQTPGTQTPAESGVTAAGEAEEPDAESSAQKNTAESGEKTGTAQMADGIYVLTLDSTSGSAALSSGVLFVSGSPDYAATGSGLYDGSAQTLQEGYYAFHCGSATIYQSSGGDGEPDMMSAAEFSQYLQGVEGSGLGLRITVQGGVVVCADIAS